MLKNEKKLIELLKGIWDDEEFIRITMRSFKNEVERGVLIKLINENKNISVSDINAYSFFIDEKHENKENEK